MSEPKMSPEREAAEIRKADAEIEKFAAETRKLTAEARAAEDVAESSMIALVRVRETRDKELVTDERKRVYRYTSEVSASSVAACMAALTAWSRLDELAGVAPVPIEVIFTSPGGNVLHGMALFDFLRSLSAAGHAVTTTDLGYAASMAGILLQAGDVRRIGKESYLHIHEIASGMSGKLAEIEDEVLFMKKVTKRVVDIFVSRSQGKISARRLRGLFERKEAWFSSDEALKFGLIDEVV